MEWVLDILSLIHISSNLRCVYTFEVNATLLSDFSDIIGNRHKNPFFTSNVYTHLKLEDAQREMELSLIHI